jgi:putative phage-type endonuclease
MAALSPLRTGRITGSRIGAILGLNRYSSRADVLAEMLTQARGQDALFNGNEATQWGNDHEDDALTAYEAERSVLTYGGQGFFIHPVYDFLACTPDGFVGLDGMVECKCPYRALYTDIKQKPEYEAQIRLQLECTAKSWCDFVVWRADGIHVTRVEHDPNWLPLILPALTKFMDDFNAALTEVAA